MRGISLSKKKSKNTRSLLKVFPGFTVLVFDTNIVLSSLPFLRELVDSRQWTIVIPLAGEQQALAQV